MARTGLRMMPTFPSAPLKFRTVSFPQYGFKAGFQLEPSSWDTNITYPASLLPPFVFAIASMTVRAVSEILVWPNTAMRALPLYPRGPRSGPGCSVPVHHRLFDPIRPTGRHIAISLLGNLYAMPSLCVSA